MVRYNRCTIRKEGIMKFKKAKKKIVKEYCEFMRGLWALSHEEDGEMEAEIAQAVCDFSKAKTLLAVIDVLEYNGVEEAHQFIVDSLIDPA